MAWLRVAPRRPAGRARGLAEIEHERRAGYAWLGPWARNLLERRYPEWKGRPGAEP